MKKIYLSLCTLVFIASSYTQVKDFSKFTKRSPLTYTPAPIKKGIKPDNLNDKAVIWSNTFSNASEWELSNSSEPTMDWAFSNVPGVINFGLGAANFASTTVSDGFIVLDSDGAGQSATQDALIQNVTPINLSSNPQVFLTFEQFHSRYQEQTIVSVSGDNGVTWTDFPINTAVAVNTSTSNPDYVQLNISAVAGGQSEVKIAFHYIGAWDYGWAIDDVKIIEAPDYELELEDVFFGSDSPWGNIPFYVVPENQIAPISFAGAVLNNGLVDQGDVVFNVTNSFIGSSNASVLPSSVTDTLDVLTSYTPDGSVTQHIFNYNTTSSAVDDNPTNNSFPADTVTISEYIYALDRGYITSNSWNQGQGYEIGNIFNIYTNTTLYSAKVNLSSYTAPGTEIYIKLYEMDPTSTSTVYLDYFIELFVNQNFYTFTSSDGDKWITIPFEIAQNLEAGKSYALVVGSYGTGGVGNDLVVNSSGTSDLGNSCFYDYPDARMYSSIGTPMVRMDFGIPMPIITSSEPDLAGCTGETMTLTSSYPSGNQWFLNGNPINGETGSTLTVSTAGTYSVVSGGLSSMDAVVTFNAIPLVTYNQVLADVCPNYADVVLTPGTPSGGTFSGENVTASAFNPENPGTYIITYSVTQNGCTGSDTTSIIVQACLSVSENELANITIYPNPTTGTFTVTNTENLTSIELVDHLGRTLSSWNVDQVVMNLDVTKIAQGNYILIFRGNHSSTIRQVQITK